MRNLVLHRNHVIRDVFRTVRSRAPLQRRCQTRTSLIRILRQGRVNRNLLLLHAE
jgi:hypothetical protein